MLNKWGNRIHHVHFKDVRPSVLNWVRTSDKSFLDGVAEGVFSVPGDPEGAIDFQGIVDQLKKMEYEGWIVVEAEQDPAKAPPFKYSKIGYETIRGHCAQAGLSIKT